MIISRRQFVRTASLAVVGGVFVPKFERWFRPVQLLTPRGGRLMRNVSVYLNDQLLAEGLDFEIVDAGAGVIKMIPTGPPRKIGELTISYTAAKRDVEVIDESLGYYGGFSFQGVRSELRTPAFYRTVFPIRKENAHVVRGQFREYTAGNLFRALTGTD